MKVKTNLDELEILGFRKTEVYNGRFGEIQVWEKGNKGCLYYLQKDLILVNFEFEDEWKKKFNKYS